mmetsp:Transcript_9715/g.35583  ORF Transcript_9715/g.35583 Transcript_9715/m.35583 type:complete len:584 (-) Transcript_9715:110-1861(-)
MTELAAWRGLAADRAQVSPVAPGNDAALHRLGDNMSAFRSRVVFGVNVHLRNAASPYAHMGRLLTGTMTTAHTLREPPPKLEKDGEACRLSAEDVGLNGKKAEVPCNSGALKAIAEAESHEIANRLFSDINLSGNGVISKAELREYAEARKLPVCYMHKFLLQADTSGDGLVSRKEFENFVRIQDRRLSAAFSALDQNGDGRISPAELLKGLREYPQLQGACGSERAPLAPSRRTVQLLLNAMDIQCNLKCPETCGVIEFPQFREFFALLPSSASVMSYWVDAAEVRSRIDCGGRITTDKAAADKSTAASHLLAGSVAGAVSRTFTAPLETVRIKLMCGQGIRGGIMANMRSIVQTDGVQGLFRGNATNVLRFAPTKGIDFVTFNLYKEKLSQTLGKNYDIVQRIAAGAGAGATSTLLLYPLDVIRTRLTNCNIKMTSGAVIQYVGKMWSTEGVGAFYRGLGPALSGMIPEAAIVYGSYDLLKDGAARALGVDQLGLVGSLGCGVVAALSGQTVAYPLEAISRRMAMGVEGNMLQIAIKVTREEGALALFKGIPAASAKVIPMAMLSFGTYEAIQRLLDRPLN